MRPSTDNTERNMGKKCRIQSVTHSCKGPGGVEDAFCHAVPQGTDDDGDSCFCCFSWFGKFSKNFC